MLSFFLVASKIYLIGISIALLVLLYQVLPKVYQLEKEGKNWANELLLVIIGSFYGIFGMIATMFWIGLILTFCTDVAYLAWNFIGQLAVVLVVIVLIIVLTVGLAKAQKKA
ncbi:hypothetical protein [Aureispira sp. CCB-QB1]|uniref:hypothetical protein n=1 Tax=Aureispira sp. CCB-QB1 TaxID=1313421 RepID=UPI0006967C1E|nr:hypothetical protein [Aureispira sp. CCB-QB1]